jgi:translation initiation factor 2 beta subunit (eIF-2beta)/eIF-5
MNGESTNNSFDVEISLDLDENELYYYLLENIYESLDSTISTESGNKISKPDVSLDISRKTVWKNFKCICNQINRNNEEDILHILKFFKKELSVNSSVNKDGHVLIRGRYTSDMIGNILKRYIKIFLKCDPCKGMNTTVERKQNKLTYIICHNDKCNYEKVINYDL